MGTVIGWSDVVSIKRKQQLKKQLRHVLAVNLFIKIRNAESSLDWCECWAVLNEFKT